MAFTKHKLISIVVVDDDPDYKFIFKEAYSENKFTIPLVLLEDGNQLIDFLDNNENLLPSLVLMDLYMPGKSGLEVLEELKKNSFYKTIPTLIVSSTDLTEDILKTYDLGASSFISKPKDFAEFVKSVSVIVNYWFNLVQLPN